MKNNKLLTVGQLAKEMDVTVRTLQYYDKEGLLKPSQKSEGGRRLYTDKDIVKLHQILSLKYLGFSLDKIKDNLFSLDDPIEVAKILEQQGEIIKFQIDKLKSALETTETLHDEVIQMKTVDFSKYADIVSLIKQQNENYWVVKLFDDKLSSHMRKRFKDREDDGLNLFNKYSNILDKAVLLKKQGELPNSDKSISVAKEWWDMINEFTEGDMSILPELMKFNENKDGWDTKMASKQRFIDDFIDKALMAYFEKENIIISEMESV